MMHQEIHGGKGWQAEVKAGGIAYLAENINIYQQFVGRESDKTEQDLLKTILKQVCEKQLSAFVLKDLNTLTQKTNRLFKLYSFHSSKQGKYEFFYEISKGFPGFDKPYLTFQQEKDIFILKDYFNEKNLEIIVSLCTWFVGAATILSYMKATLGLPLKIDFNYAHSGKTAINLKQNTDPKIPSLSIIADGPSSFIFENYDRDPKYIPLGYAPPCEHRIILHKESHKWYRSRSNLSGEYHVVNHEELISTPILHLNSLVNQNRINKDQIKIVKTEPGGQLPIFLSGADDTRSIFCDPQWQVISIWHPNTFIVHDKESFWSDVIIHAEEYFSQTEECQAFLRLFYGCWYDMKYNLGSLLIKGIDALIEDTDYSRLLLYFCGLR